MVSPATNDTHACYGIIGMLCATPLFTGVLHAIHIDLYCGIFLVSVIMCYDESNA